MGCCCPRKVIVDSQDNERRPLVLSVTVPAAPQSTGLVESQIHNQQPSPPNTQPQVAAAAAAATLPPSAFKYLDRREQQRVELPNLHDDAPQLQQKFSDICQLYNDTIYTNMEKLCECVALFKRTLGVSSQLHMRECFRNWRSRIINPVFRVTLTDDKKLVKEIVVRAERGNIPQEIWEAQKYIRETLDISIVFLSQYRFIEQSVNEGLHKARKLLSDAAANKSLEPPVLEKAQSLLEQYQFAFGQMSRFNDEVTHLMNEIKDSVDALRD
ncbi:PREDICTED: uncharacterized protein LOC109580205 [Amphimedon queenslandica]|uniref:Uncharacterized protein n=1 Tax=Amphimedon queenslandica TaxID=400682 RepID=A0A1X7VJ00_AMPQE|nr:PREDICTED: uncharacterized protein LOC109580205 [Amphimedon queenslandica]|eukprot:XP_019848688.1 PREDICTED: uncharacterized protein LOC109580205 [Amphimedon queenslandica]